jgi:very-short-patch-repair endonuclease
VAEDLSLTRRRELRRRSTEAEALLWRHLRDRRFQGIKLRRQHPIGHYIVDFFCPRRRLAIELDGGQHFDPSAQAHDERRSQDLARRGIRVVRFTNTQVFEETEAVLEAIMSALAEAPHPGPLPGRPGRG